jgi:hypothetical protein
MPNGEIGKIFLKYQKMGLLKFLEITKDIFQK